MDAIERGIDALHVLYGRILTWALGHRKSVIALALVSFFASFLVVPLVGTEFIPEADQSFTSLRLNTPVGSSLEYTDAKVQAVEEVLKRFPEIDLVDDDRRHRRRAQLRARQPAAGRPQGPARCRRRISRRAIREALKPIPGIELAIGYNRPDLGQSARARPGDADHADQRIRRQGRQGTRHRRHGDARRRRPTRRCPSGSTTTPRPTSASRCSRSAPPSGRCSPATRWRTGSRPTDRTTKSTCSCRRISASSPPIWATSTSPPTSEGPTASCAWCRCARSPRSSSRPVRSSIKRQDLQRRVALYAGTVGPPVRRRRRRRAEDHRCHRAAAGLSLRRRRTAEGHGRVVPGRAGGARARDHLHLSHPGVAVRELHPAGRDHGVAAVLADRRVPRAAASPARRSTSSPSSASSC